MPFYIKQRHNPQTGIYYVPYGKLSKAAAKRKENSLYGSNVMLPFDNEEDYNKKLEELRAAGEKVQ